MMATSHRRGVHGSEQRPAPNGPSPAQLRRRFEATAWARRTAPTPVASAWRRRPRRSQTRRLRRRSCNRGCSRFAVSPSQRPAVSPNSAAWSLDADSAAAPRDTRERARPAHGARALAVLIPQSRQATSSGSRSALSCTRQCSSPRTDRAASATTSPPEVSEELAPPRPLPKKALAILDAATEEFLQRGHLGISNGSDVHPTPWRRAGEQLLRVIPGGTRLPRPTLKTGALRIVADRRH